jgi:hypothetical protein
VAIVTVTLLVLAELATAKGSNAVNITVHNTSSRTIARLYVAVGDPKNWGPDQLGGSTIPPTGSFTLSNVECNGSGVRVIAEDQNGCFVYDNASCESSQTWEITSTDTPDCGN